MTGIRVVSGHLPHTVISRAAINPIAALGIFVARIIEGVVLADSALARRLSVPITMQAMIAVLVAVHEAVHDPAAHHGNISNQSTTDTRLEPECVNRSERSACHIGVCVGTSVQSDRIALYIPPDRWVVIAEVVVSFRNAFVTSRANNEGRVVA